jgi:putative transposase
MVDGAPGPEKAITAVWNGVPLQSCTVHKHLHLLGHAPSARQCSETTESFCGNLCFERLAEGQGRAAAPNVSLVNAPVAPVAGRCRA